MVDRRRSPAGAKTDAIDAYLLAKTGRSEFNDLHLCWLLGASVLKKGEGKRSADSSETVATFVSHQKPRDLFPRSSLLVGRSQDVWKNAKSSK